MENRPIEERIFHEAPDGVLLLILAQMPRDTKHGTRQASKSLLQAMDFVCQKLEWQFRSQQNLSAAREAHGLLSQSNLSKRFPNVKHLVIERLLTITSAAEIGLLATNQLTTLSLSHCVILDDLSPLSACSNLEKLICSHTAIKDLSPLSSCTSLQHLEAHACPSLDFACLEPLIVLPRLTFVIAGKTNSGYVWRANNHQHQALMMKYLTCSNVGLQMFATMVLGSQCHSSADAEVARMAQSLDLTLILSRVMQPKEENNYNLLRASAYLLYSMTVSVEVGSLVAASEGRIFSRLVEILLEEEREERAHQSPPEALDRDPFICLFQGHLGSPMAVDDAFSFVSFTDSAMGLLANMAFEDKMKLKIYRHTPGAFDLILRYIDQPSLSPATRARATLALANLADHDELNPLIASIPGLFDRLIALLKETPPHHHESSADIIRPCAALVFANLLDGDEQKLIVGKIEGVVSFLLGYCAHMTWNYSHLFETMQWVLMAMGNLMDHPINRANLQEEFQEGVDQIYDLISQANLPVPLMVRQKAVVCLCKAALDNADKNELVSDDRVISCLAGLLSSSIYQVNVSDQILALEAMACLTDLERGGINDESTCMARLVIGAINIYASATGLSIPSCLNLLSVNGLNERVRILADLILKRLDVP